MKVVASLVYRYTGRTIEDHESLYYEPFYKVFGDEVLADGTVEYIRQNDKDGWKGESSPIEIDYMEGVINKLKKEGATHMEIMFHCDHDSYCISGVEIRRPTADEVNGHIDTEKEAKRKELLAKKKQAEDFMKNVDEELAKLEGK